MKINPQVENCANAPITEAWSWVENPDDPYLLDVCQAVPTYAPDQSMLDYLGDAIQRGEATTYTDIAGIEPLRSALAEDINQRYAASINKDNLVITAGCNQGFCSVIDTLCQNGDNVVVPVPCDFNHEMWLSIRGIDIYWLEFNKQSAEPSADNIDQLIDERTRAIILVTPNNPTGAIYSPATIDSFYDAAKRNGIPLIVDETYRDFMDASSSPHNLFSKSKWQDNFIHLYSFSKAFALTGHRVGAIAAGGKLIEQMNKIQDCVAISAPHVGQIAALFGLNNLKDWRAQKGAEMIARAKAIKQAFDHPDLQYTLINSGAYFAYIKHPFEQSSRQVGERLAKEYKVICLPGSYFGPDQDCYFRFAFANIDQRRFPELVERLIASQH